MSATDRIVVILEAKLADYERRVQNAERRFNRSMEGMRSSISSLERQIRRDTKSIGDRFGSLAGIIAGAFSVQEVARLADTWTRFGNTLRTTGLEGEELALMQDRLIAVANRNGIAIETLGELYGRLGRVSGEMGASQEDILRVTSAVAAALKVQGTSAQEAQGALLQLSQAIPSARIEMEEFGSLIDGLPVLLQAAAKYIDGTGGSVNKLRALIKDRKGPGVSGQDFFTAILRASRDLEQQASRSQLTIANSLQVLGNQLSRYVGLADDNVGATERISGAILKLADNLDTIIPALTTLATVFVGRYVGSATASTVATIRATIAVNTYQAALMRLAVAQGLSSAQGVRLAGSMAVTTGAMTRAAGAAVGLGRGLLAAFGGPIGLAITALTVGLSLYATGVLDAKDATNEHAKALKRKAAQAEAVADVTEKLIDATRKERIETRNALVAARDKAKADVAAAQAALSRARAEIKLREALAFKRVEEATRSTRGAGAGFDPAFTQSQRFARIEEENRKREKELADRAAAAQAEVDKLEAQIKAVDKLINFPRSTGEPSEKKKKSANNSARDRVRDEELLRDQTQALQRDQIAQEIEILQAKLDLTRSADERADLERQILALERNQRIAEIEDRARRDLQDLADAETISAERKAQQRALIEAERKAALERIDKLYGPAPGTAEDILVTPNPGLLNQRVTKQQLEELERQRLDMLSAQATLLEEMAAIERSTRRRNELEQQALGIREEIEKSLLAQQIANGEIADADEAQAILARQQAVRRERLRQSQRSPGQRYVEDLQDQATNINDAIEGIKIEGLERLNDELADAITGAQSLGDAFSNVANQIIRDLIRIAIQQAIIKPLAESLFGGDSGGISSLFGRASGGNVRAGQPYVVGENGPELMMPSRSGRIIPNGRIPVASGNAQPAVIELRVARGEVFETYVQKISGDVSVKTVTDAAPRIIGASVNETLRRSSRPSI